ncbi:8087_t:CDS:2, partial [Gigaspora margarita]
LYETISILNTISELDDESLTYDGQNISTSTSLQVPFYETISTLNTIAKLDDKSLTYDGQNSSTLTSLQ